MARKKAETKLSSGISATKMRKLRAEKPEEQNAKSLEHMKVYLMKNQGSELFKLRRKLANQRYYARKKMDKLEKQKEINGAQQGFKSHEIIQKKAREIEKKFSSHGSDKKIVEVAKELLKRHPVRDSSQEPKPKKPRTEAQQKVINFYRNEDNVTILPGKRDCVTRIDENGIKVKMQKFILKDSKSRMFAKFQEENPDVENIGKTTFFQLAPPNVLSFKKMPNFACLCSSHENFKFLFDAIKSYLVEKNISDYRAFRKLFCCDEKDDNCMMGRCKKCKNVKEKFKKLTRLHSSKIVLRQWKGTEIVSTTYKLKDIHAKFSKMISDFKAHSFISKIQNMARNHKLENLKPNEALAVIDFAENHKIQLHGETQTGYYSRKGYTIFTCMLYIGPSEENGENQTVKIAMTSDNLSHDSASTDAHLRELLNKISNDFPQVETLHVWSDGAPAHFKNRYSISNLITLQKDFPSITIEWNFTGSGHGKSAADMIGGTVKRMIDDRIKAQQLIIQTAEEYYENAVEICNGFDIIFLPSTKFDELADDFEGATKDAREIKGIRGRHKFQVVDGTSIRSFRTSFDDEEKIHKVFR